MDIEIHVQRRIPPFSQGPSEHDRVGELKAGARLEVIDEAALCAHGYVASPTGEGGRGVLGHVLMKDVSTTIHHYRV